MTLSAISFFTNHYIIVQTKADHKIHVTVGTAIFVPTWIVFSVVFK